MASKVQKPKHGTGYFDDFIAKVEKQKAERAAREAERKKSPDGIRPGAKKKHLQNKPKPKSK